MTKKAYAKVNIFLKIAARRADGYHNIVSRFMRVENLYDTIAFVRHPKGFDVVGVEGCDLKDNTVYKAYRALLDATKNEEIGEFFRSYRVEIEKKIPAFAGLGGGSSDAASFLLLCNEVFSLGLTQEALVRIGLQVGADVPFFLYEYDSANVTGIGEIVVAFEERPLCLEVAFPGIAIATPKVYKAYSQKFYKPIDRSEQQKWLALSSANVLRSKNAFEANDLLKPALALYPQLKEHLREGWFFSGSGSAFFRAV